VRVALEGQDQDFASEDLVFLPLAGDDKSNRSDPTLGDAHGKRVDLRCFESVIFILPRRYLVWNLSLYSVMRWCEKDTEN
jgi:hypothetical protein